MSTQSITIGRWHSTETFKQRLRGAAGNRAVRLALRGRPRPTNGLSLYLRDGTDGPLIQASVGEDAAAVDAAMRETRTCRGCRLPVEICARCGVRKEMQ